MSKSKIYFRNEKSTDIWLTPLALVRSLGTFDLDPCAFPGHKTATRLFTLPETDGLLEDWCGRVWLNPPYGAECGKWVHRLASHGNGTALVFARLETVWFQSAVKKASAVFFPKGRISFLRATGEKAASASAPSAYLAFGEYDAFALSLFKLPGWFIRL